jgi:2-aminoethylphosphonate-pyruvate transaminase
MKKVSLTPAVFHLSDRVNSICHRYAQQPIVPRGPALKPILDRVRKKTVTLLNAEENYKTIIFSSSGSGAIAASMGSCVDNNGILIVINDAYGERQADFCEQLGIKTIRYELEWGVKPDINQIEALITQHKVGTIGMVHGCTSVCLLNPIEEIGKLCQQLNLRFIVDAIASVFVEDINLNDWGIDTLICSTNKALHSNPDLSFCIVKKDYLEEMKQSAGRIPYFDMVKTYNAQEKGGHPFTINIRALLEFEAALDDFEERGGLKARIKMYQNRISILRNGYEKMGLATYQKEDMAQQNIGTALFLPQNVKYDRLADDLANWDNGEGESYEIYSAQGKLSDQVFRIFNMGEYTLDTYKRFLIALEVCLNKV